MLQVLFTFLLSTINNSYALTPNDPDFSKQWYLSNASQNQIYIEKAWEITTGSPKVIVALIDTGIDYNNPELTENIWTNFAELNGKPGVDDDKNGFIDDIHGYDFVNNDGDPMDDFSHGTHLASIIGAKGNNGIAMAGIAWNVRLMAVKVLNSGNRQDDARVIAQGIRYAVSNGANIINASLAINYLHDEGDLEVQKAVEYAEDHNVLIVAGSGNDGEDLDYYPMIPAVFPHDNILTVTACDQEGWQLPYANISKTSVDLTAPGKNIWGLLPSLGSRFWGGTSQATAITTGVAALVLSKYPELKPTQIKERIMKSVNKSQRLSGTSVTDGLLDAYKALL